MEEAPQVDSTKALDSEWYGRLESVIFEDYSKFEADKMTRELAKQAFLLGMEENPTFLYPELDRFDYESKEAELLSLKADILEREPNEAVRKIYRIKINEVIADIRMLRASRDGDDKKFDRYSSFLYGKPSAESLEYITGHLKQKVRPGKNDSEVKSQAKRRLLELISTNDVTESVDESVIFPKPSADEQLVSGVEEAESAFNDALQKFELEGWKVLVDKSGALTNFSTSQEKKTIRVPGEEALMRRKLSRNKMEGLIAHEVGVHAVRRQNGERSKLQLLGLGLDRYIKGEEGVATYMEQQVTGTKQYAGIPAYLAIALAKGYGGDKRDFRQTFEIMKDYYLTTLKDGDDIVDRDNDSAWTRCVRIFRGTNCSTPGAVYAKDLAYFEGNRETWHLVNENSDVVESFSVGKFDAARDDHVALLSQLGILDEDLSKLEE